jgi:hypothetical protein
MDTMKNLVFQKLGGSGDVMTSRGMHGVMSPSYYVQLFLALLHILALLFSVVHVN